MPCHGIEWGMKCGGVQSEREHLKSSYCKGWELLPGPRYYVWCKGKGGGGGGGGWG